MLGIDYSANSDIKIEEEDTSKMIKGRYSLVIKNMGILDEDIEPTVNIKDLS